MMLPLFFVNSEKVVEDVNRPIFYDFHACNQDTIVSIRLRSMSFNDTEQT